MEAEREKIQEKFCASWGSCYSLSKTAANSVMLSQAKVLALSPSPCLALNSANMHEYRVLNFRFMVPKFMVLRINKKLLWWLRAAYPISPES